MQDGRPSLVLELAKGSLFDLDEIMFRGESMRDCCAAQGLSGEVMLKLEALSGSGRCTVSVKALALCIATDSYLKRKCGCCGKDLSLKADRKGSCSRCKSIYYCSASCQSSNWSGWHQLACRELRKE